MNSLGCALSGFRTIVVALALALTGMLGVLGQLDLTPIVALFVKDPAYLGAAMVVVAAVFGFLRFLSSTPMFKRREAPDGEGRKPGVDEGV